MGERIIRITTQLEGEKEVTKSRYVRRWDEHFNKLLGLAGTPDEVIKLKSIRLASCRFEHLYKEQHPRTEKPQ